MTTLTPQEATQEIDSVLLAARADEARHIEIIVRPTLAVVRFSHEEWTKVFAEWSFDHAEQVMAYFFLDLEKTQGKPDDPRPEEALLNRSAKGPVEIRARITTVPQPQGFDVIINLL
jgi:hypothetical protein